MEQIKVNQNDQLIEVVSRVVHSDYDDNRYINYKGDTYLVDGYYNGEIDLDQPHEPVKQYRKVVDTGEVAHLWAHQSQQEARNSRENFYFEGRSIYSYGSHFEIARLVDVPTEENPVVLFNNTTYSNTTSRHQSHVQSAIPHDYKVFSFDAYQRGMGYYGSYVLFDYGPNWQRKEDYRRFIQCHMDEMKELRESIPRKQKESTYRSEIIAFRLHREKIEDFIETFRCKSVLTQAELKEIYSPIFEDFSEFMRVTRRVFSARERGIEREREKERKRMEYFKGNLENVLDPIIDFLKTDPLAHWKETGRFPELPREAHDDIRFWQEYPQQFEDLTGYSIERTVYGYKYAYIRFNESRDSFQTSKGAFIEVADAEKLLRLYDTKGQVVKEMVKYRKSGGEFEHFHNERITIGFFTSIPQINADGDIRFGCHNVPASEIEWARGTIDTYNKQERVHQ